MHHATLAAAARRFPLLGRPRPTCPPLPQRIQEITEAVATAKTKSARGLADAAHALNKAALIASDGGRADLAEQICWQHIDAYRHLLRALTIEETRYLLEPVLNLARLKLRANQGTDALCLLEAMYHAITRRTDLTIGQHTLPTAGITGAKHDRRQLCEWVWLQLIGEGVRAFTLANRWDTAVAHAAKYNGIGVHLMEGRQAAILAHCLNGTAAKGRTLLAHSTPTQPWEHQIAACLHIMCTQPTDPLLGHHLTIAAARYRARTSEVGYGSYRARLGLTIATLASPTRPDLATTLLEQVVTEAIDSADGYAARDVLGYSENLDGITSRQRAALSRVAAESGLGLGTLSGSLERRLTAAAGEAVAVLDSALGVAVRRAPQPHTAGRDSAPAE